MSNGRALVLCSGGLDSSCLAAYLRMEMKMKVFPLFVDRGQRAVAQEKAAFVSVTDHLMLRENALHASYDISEVTSVQDATEGGDAGFIPHPERNLVLVSLAYAFAAALNSPTVYVACNADDGDADIPDSRLSFFEGLTSVLQLLKPHGKIKLPFAEWPKSKIISWASDCGELGPDFLKLTRTCWQKTTFHCGKCNACRIRIKAFEQANVDDPTIYADP